jgi:hypothetical protein
VSAAPAPAELLALASTTAREAGALLLDTRPRPPQRHLEVDPDRPRLEADVASER